MADNVLADAAATQACVTEYYHLLLAYKADHFLKILHISLHTT